MASLTLAFPGHPSGGTGWVSRLCRAIGRGPRCPGLRCHPAGGRRDAGPDPCEAPGRSTSIFFSPTESLAGGGLGESSRRRDPRLSGKACRRLPSSWPPVRGWEGREEGRDPSPLSPGAGGTFKGRAAGRERCRGRLRLRVPPPSAPLCSLPFPSPRPPGTRSGGRPWWRSWRWRPSRTAIRNPVPAGCVNGWPSSKAMPTTPRTSSRASWPPCRRPNGKRPRWWWGGTAASTWGTPSSSSSASPPPTG